MSLFYNKTEIDALVASKAVVSHTHPYMNMTFGEAVSDATKNIISSNDSDVTVRQLPDTTWEMIAVNANGTLDLAECQRLRIEDSHGRLSQIQSEVLPDLSTDLSVRANLSFSAISEYDRTMIGGWANGEFISAMEVIGRKTVNAHAVTCQRVATSSMGAGSVQINNKKAIDSEGTLLVLNTDGQFVGVGADSGVTASFFNVASVRALKTCIEDFREKALDILMAVELVKFTYKQGTGEERYGFLAEDTAEILSGPDRDRFEIPNTIGVLIKAVQELAGQQRLIEARLGV